jgi:hypothetical protein
MYIVGGLVSRDLVWSSVPMHARYGEARQSHGMKFIFEFCFPDGEIETEYATQLNTSVACPKDPLDQQTIQSKN